MAGITIGRVGLYDSLELGKPEIWNEQGSAVEVGGHLLMSSVTDAKWMRRQLLGLLDPGGDGGAGQFALPVIWAGDPTIDGYYLVTDVDVPVGPGSLRHGVLPWRVRLERPVAWRNPLVEDLVISTVLTNSHALAPTISVATAIATDQDYAATTNPVTFASSAGSAPTTSFGEQIRYYLYSSGLGSGPGTALYQLGVTKFFYGAVRLEVGNDKRVLVGTNTDQDSATNWRISNGLIRVSNTTNALKVGIWTGAAWETKDFNVYLSEGTGYLLNQWDNFTILRNTPEQCTIRCTIRETTTSDYTNYLDVTVKKGRRLVEVAFTLAGSGSQDFGFRIAGAGEAGTNITGGIRAAADDGSGNRYFMLSPSGITTNTADGRIRITTSATSALFCLGLELNGSTQTEALEQITGTGGLRDSFFRTAHTSRRVVAP